MANGELVGCYTHKLDAKNRVFFPAPFREDLGSAIVVTVNLDKGLTAYSSEEWDKLITKLKESPKTKVREASRFFCCRAIKVKPDSQGRIMLSQQLIDYANIKEKITFLGCGDRVELWPEENSPLNKYDDVFLEELAEQLIDLGI